MFELTSVLPPVETKGLKVPEDVPALIEKVRAQMTVALEEISQKPAPKRKADEPRKSTSSSTAPLIDSKQPSYESTGKADVPVDTLVDVDGAELEKEPKLNVA